MLNVDFKSPKLWAQAGVVFLLITFIALDIDHLVEDSSTPRLTWTRKAALEAEQVAAIYCSNHGRAYSDGNRNTTTHLPVCECHNCYSGNTCAEYDRSTCVADATVGDALFLRKYWMHERQNIAVLISGWHRMSYFIGKNFMSEELERNIRLLHKKVGNANVTDEHKIVFGNGITQLLNGVIISLSPDLNTNPNATVMNVVAAAPYYPVFKSQTTFFNHTGYRWKGNALDYVNTTNPQDFIEIVTSPNNPDGYLRKSVIPGSVAVYDHATYWPHYAPIVEESDEDIMLFTLGKYTGHSGSRFGWAILKNQDVYDKLTKYVATNSEGVSRETQFRTLKIVKDILQEKQLHHEDFNEFGYKVLRERWVKVTTLVSFSDRFSVQEMSSEYCNYFKRIREPATAYAWLRCNWEDEEDCAAVLETGKIKANSGVHYEASSRFVRVSLVKTDDDFDQLMERLTALVHTPPADRNILLYHSIINQESSTRRPFIPDADY